MVVSPLQSKRPPIEHGEGRLGQAGGHRAFISRPHNFQSARRQVVDLFPRLPRSEAGERHHNLSATTDLLNARIVDAMFIMLPTSGGCPDSMTPPGCNELSATWHRQLNTKSKNKLGIPSAETWLLRK